MVIRVTPKTAGLPDTYPASEDRTSGRGWQSHRGRMKVRPLFFRPADGLEDFGHQIHQTHQKENDLRTPPQTLKLPFEGLRGIKLFGELQQACCNAYPNSLKFSSFW
jgi:hypothetical protein